MRSRMTSTMTGTWCSTISFFACSRAGRMSSGAVTRNALQPRPSTTWPRPVDVQHLGGLDLRQSDRRDVPGIGAEGNVHLLIYALRLHRHVVEVGTPLQRALAFPASRGPLGAIGQRTSGGAFPADVDQH